MSEATLCSICQEAVPYDLIETPCHHSFHKSCLQQIVRPGCPLCKTDLTDFLTSHGLVASKAEVDAKVQLDDLRITCQALEHEEPRNLSDEEIYTIATMARKNTRDWEIVYRDIVLDQIGNSSVLFNRISELKYKQSKEVGLFCYALSADKFVRDTLDPHSASQAQWAYLSTFDFDVNIYRTVLDYTQRIKPSMVGTHFAVLIVWHDEQSGNSYYCPRVMSSTAKGNKELIKQVKSHWTSTESHYIGGVSSDRPAQRDILGSLMRAQTCRCSGNTPNDQNREYKWAKNYLQRLENKLKSKKII